MLGGKTRNVYLGSCNKMGHEEALARARRRKAEEMSAGYGWERWEIGLGTTTAKPVEALTFIGRSGTR